MPVIESIGCYATRALFSAADVFVFMLGVFVATNGRSLTSQIPDVVFCGIDAIGHCVLSMLFSATNAFVLMIGMFSAM